jgi:hypothetical protein
MIQAEERLRVISLRLVTSPLALDPVDGQDAGEIIDHREGNQGEG